MWLLLTLLGSAYVLRRTMSRKGEHNGQTLGKQAAGIRVVRDDGRPIRLGFAVLREVGLKYSSPTSSSASAGSSTRCGRSASARTARCTT